MELSQPANVCEMTTRVVKVGHVVEGWSLSIGITVWLTEEVDVSAVLSAQGGFRTRRGERSTPPAPTSSEPILLHECLRLTFPMR
jgi:hypothetical protein